MEHLAIYFRHSIQDIIPYSDFIVRVRPVLEERGIGEYLGDDMAIDGGDAEGVFRGRSAKELWDFLQDDLKSLPFMRGAKVSLIYGDLEEDCAREDICI